MNDFFNKFHIGTYYFQKNARTESGVKDLKDCGIDLVFCIDNDRNTLDLFAKYGVYADVSGVVPGWFGGHGENAGTMAETNKKEAYVKGLNAFVDHPAIAFIDAGDEPSSVDFPHYGKMLEVMKELVPSKTPYLNIYPSYAMLASNSPEQTKKELGVDTYKEYVDAYGKYIDLPYISFDHYYLTSSPDRLIADIKTAADYCKENKKKLFVVLQVNSILEEVHVSEAQLAFQAFSAMAHGAKIISWACYSKGWWYHNVLDADGNKTEQYDKLKKVNHKLIAVAEDCFDYDWADTERINGSASHGAFKNITASSDAIVGKFVKGDKEAILVSPVDIEADEYTVTFSADGNAYANCGHGKEKLVSENGAYKVTFKKAEACFITIE